MKRMTLCADDFAIHPGVSEAIIQLAAAGRIHASSCLVTSSGWKNDCQLLASVSEKIDIGLHLNFSEETGLSPTFKQGFPSLNTLLIKSHLRQLNPKSLEEEICAQLDTFSEQTGQVPDFIDGHQHVHQFPQIRNALFRVISSKKYSHLWIRSTAPLLSNTSFIKSTIIRGTGSHNLKRLIRKRSLVSNSAFAGIYSLSEHADFPRLLVSWMKHLPDAGLIMCHPGLALESTNIDHALARQKEFEYLSGNTFSENCKDMDIQMEKPSLILK